MGVIIQNITDPVWWFSGLFFAVVAYLLPKFIQLISSMPLYAKHLQRKIQLTRLRKIKNIRYDNTKVVIEAIKTSTWMVVFILSTFVFFYTFLAGSLILFDISGAQKVPMYALLVGTLKNPIPGIFQVAKSKVRFRLGFIFNRLAD